MNDIRPNTNNHHQDKALREKQKCIVLVFHFIQYEYFILGEFGPYFGSKWYQSQVNFLCLWLRVFFFASGASLKVRKRRKKEGKRKREKREVEEEDPMTIQLQQLNQQSTSINNSPFYSK